jgi:hypothetical protein
MTTSQYDPHDHPDLRHLDAHISREFDDILAAERHAARISVQRRMTIRDRLVRAEDLACDAVIETTNGVISGAVVAVGSDHVVVEPGRVIALAHIVGFQVAD